MIFLLKQDYSSVGAEPEGKECQRSGGQRNSFFRRSESMLFLGSTEDETFELTYAESLPLRNGSKYMYM